MTFTEIAKRIRACESADIGRGASRQEISDAARILGVEFPQDYSEFLEQLGWGGIGDLELYGLGSDVPIHLSLVTITESERSEMQPPLPPALIPLANDGAGNLFCLDVSHNWRSASPVVLWNHDEGPDQLPEFVADGFSTWLNAEVASRE
jgi:cell wall assembly regulator SMI1